MKFFVPHCTTAESTAQVYEGIRKFAAQEMGDSFQLSDRKILSIEFREGKEDCVATVGKPCSVNAEDVFAILYVPSRRLYLVATTNRGALKGPPIMVGEDEVRWVNGLRGLTFPPRSTP